MEVTRTLVLAVLALTVGLCLAEKKVTICVPQVQTDECSYEDPDTNEEIVCKKARDKIECMRWVDEGKVDTVNLEPETMYTAGEDYNLQPVAMNLVGDKQLSYRYRAVAVVRSSSNINKLEDLKGKKSCHTGLGRNAGWKIPVSVLFNKLKDSKDFKCDNEIAAISSFFDESCAPGEWSVDEQVDKVLKKQYQNLCSLCGKSCDKDDPYYGYTETLKCLKDKNADVAFTKLQALKGAGLSDDYKYLCENGTTVALDVANPCFWAERPTSAFMAKKDKDASAIVTILKSLFNKYKASPPNWFKNVYGDATGVEGVPDNKKTWIEYLGNYILTINRTIPGCEEEKARFCVSTDTEEEKCKDFKNAAYGQFMRPSIECVKKSDCIDAVSKDDADLITLDGGDVYKAGKDKKMLPIVSEQYSSDKDDIGSYYAVAVVRAGSGIENLPGLRGKKSCHTGMGRTAGWIVPVGKLLEASLLKKDVCAAEAIADFFSESCVPGANDKKYNPKLKEEKKLCKLCKGDKSGNKKCSRGSEEEYSGYNGAFRCLAENAGDVAFVKHTTAISLTDGKSTLDWAKDLKSDQFRLLCDSTEPAAITEYKTCNLALVPSHFTMTSEKSDYIKRVNLVNMLTTAGKKFSADSPTFRLFGTYNNKSDLLFKDSTIYLKSVKFNSTYNDTLGKDYLKIIEKSSALVECSSASSVISTLSVMITAVLLSLLSSR